MKNPLNKRFARELKSEFGKYIAIFLFVTLMTGFTSGFFISGKSLQASYKESHTKYNVEDGNFELSDKADEEIYQLIEEQNASLYENFYIEEETLELDSTVRIFKYRTDVNLVCLMSGKLPVSDNEIAIDRVYAKNNKLSIGDTLTIADKPLEITGIVALPDYSTLFSSPSDMMFDTTKFSIAIMTESGFDNMSQSHIHYCYSWIYDSKPTDDAEAKTRAEDLLEAIIYKANVKEFIPAFSNQAIIFAGNDIGSDTFFIIILLYIIIIIVAFIFAILTSNTIQKEATVIGTLRASGYTKFELIKHYMAMPMLVTLISAVVGNVLGYTVFKGMCAEMYTNSYSLPTYETLWNANAFLLTTVMPLIILFFINFFMLASKLKLSPLKFIRRDLSKNKKKKAFRLNTKIGIMTRFRLRVIFQNMPNYITIFIGVFLANTILLFGLSLFPMLDHYQDEIVENMICDYQYILKMPVETENGDAEKFCTTSLKTINDGFKDEDATVYGISEGSSYMDVSFGDGVYISNAYAAKFKIEEGDTINLRDSYQNKDYSFKVDGIYTYPAGITLFMDFEKFNETFGMEEGYFSGYFSNNEITDIDDMFVASKITADELTKTSRQLTTTFNDMAGMIEFLGIIMFMLIIYLLSKIIIEKNAQSISMTKILGYKNSEINGLYIATTAIVVVASLLISTPLANGLIAFIYPIALKDYSGYFFYYVPFSIFVETILFGLLCYGVIAFLQTYKVKKVPLDIALKNVE